MQTFCNINCYYKNIIIVIFLCYLREELENTNITFNQNNTVSYVPRRTPHLVPELSVGDPLLDYVKIPNIALLVSL